MKEDIIKTLEDYGLKNKESQVFTFLVGKNALTGYEIAKNLGLFRSTTYEVLEKLIDKGFVSKSESGKTTKYSANEITSIISRLKTKEDLLINLSPKLNKLKLEKPSTKVLEGEIGQKQYNFEIANLIKEKKISELYIIGNNLPENETESIFIERILKEIQKSRPKSYGIYKGIWSDKFKNSKFIKKYNKFGENRFLPNIPSKTITFIANNFVGFFFSENEVPYVIEIKSKTIANEMKSYFELLWNLAKR